MARGGVEPPTYRFSGGRSYQLSYLAKDQEQDRGDNLAKIELITAKRHGLRFSQALRS